MTAGMKVLVALIVAMGIAIVAALGLVAYGIMAGYGGGKERGFGTATLAMPTGCEVAESRLEGDRLVIRLKGEAPACQQVILVDPEDGQEVGRLRFSPAPPE